MKKVHDLEVKAFSLQSTSQRYNYFVEKVYEWKEAWGLADQDGWVVAEINDTVIFPLWPAQAFANTCQVNEWENTEAKKINFEELINEFLPSLRNDNVNVATFIAPTNEQCGVLPAQELLNDFLVLIERDKLTYIKDIFR